MSSATVSSAAANLGEPLPLEPRGAPVIAGVVSLALHAALLLVALPGWGGRRAEPPVLAAAKNELALSIVRPAPRRTESDTKPDTKPDTRTLEDSVEAPRPVTRPEALERIPTPRPVAKEAPPVAPRIVRAPAPTPTVARPEVETVLHAAYDSAGGIRKPKRIGDARPQYPSACRGERHRPGGCAGTGRYAIEVDATGRLLSAKTVESAGCGHLDAAAVRFLLRGARFEPGTMDGVRIPWEGWFTIRFDLKERGAGRE